MAILAENLSVPEAPAITRIEPPRNFLELRLRDVWSYRELLFFLVWRNLKVRYKQTVIDLADATIDGSGDAPQCSFGFWKCFETKDW